MKSSCHKIGNNFQFASKNKNKPGHEINFFYSILFKRFQFVTFDSYSSVRSFHYSHFKQPPSSKITWKYQANFWLACLLPYSTTFHFLCSQLLHITKTQFFIYNIYILKKTKQKRACTR